MSGSPLLEPLRRHKLSDSPLKIDSPVRPRVLAPLFANAAASDVHGKFSGSRIDQVQYGQNVEPGAQLLLHSSPIAKRPSPAGSSGSNSKPTSPQLLLVPKNIAKLAACGRDALLKMIDPQPDWTLSDLRAELDALGDKISTSSRIAEECCDKPESRVEEMASKQRWAWDDEVADFSRPSKPFIMRLDDDDDDDDDEDDEEEDKIEKLEQSFPSSASKNRFPDILARAEKKILPVAAAEELLPALTDKVEAELYEADRMRLLRVQEELRLKRFQLESVLMEETHRSAEKLAQVMKDEETKCEMTRRSDKQYQRIVAEQRDKHLSELQRDHEQRSQVEERKIRKEEEAQRREVAVREEQRRAKAEAEAAAAAKVAEAERLKKAEIQRVETEKAEAAHRAEAEKREAEQKQQKQQQQQELASKKRSEGPQLKVSKAAADDELSRRKILQELHQASQSLQSNPTLQKNYKVLGYQISKILNQVTATEEQVRKKSMELLHLLNTPQIQAFVVSTLASKLMSQCETQVSRVPSYAYVFARIVVIVSNQVPVVMDAIIAQLNLSCILTVPKFFMYNKADYESDKSYFKLLGYREDDTGTLETADEFVSRMSAYVTLYAAITQTQGDNRHGISNGWAWCARLLNHLPANRYTASALFSYFETAGFRLHETYPKPFAKLMQSVVTKFVPLLQKHNDPDARAILNRLETYIVTQQFLKRPDDQLSQQVYSTTILRES